MRIGVVITLALVVGLCTAAMVIIFTMRQETFPAGTQTLEYVFTVAETPGVDTRTDVFRLGQLSPGGASWRSLHIEAGLGSMTREEQSQRKVLVVARGEGSAWLAIDPSIVTLPADVNITVRPPFDADLKTYGGTLYVVPYTK